MNFWNALTSFLKKPENLAVLVSVGLITFIAIVHTTSFSFMESASKRVLKPLRTVDSIQQTIADTTLYKADLKTVTLKKQYGIAEEIKKYYTNIGASYYQNYYAFTICSIFLTTLLTIAIFLLANKGWQNSSIVLRSFLLSTIVLSSIYYFLPNVLNNDKNLEKNMDKVLTYVKIQSDILTFSNVIEKATEAQIDSVIAYNYKEISDNLSFPSNIDDTSLQDKFSDLMKQFKKDE
jgi:hypothetical protein